MTTIIIEESSPQARKLLEYIKTLPFATVVDEQKNNFRQAAEECNAVSVDAFFDELDDRIKSRFNHA
jgi:hypothetical protein